MVEVWDIIFPSETDMMPRRRNCVKQSELMLPGLSPPIVPPHCHPKPSLRLDLVLGRWNHHLLKSTSSPCCLASWRSRPAVFVCFVASLWCFFPLSCGDIQGECSCQSWGLTVYPAMLRHRPLFGGFATLNKKSLLVSWTASSFMPLHTSAPSRTVVVSLTDSAPIRLLPFLCTTADVRGR